jgi:hypothetical protein
MKKKLYVGNRCFVTTETELKELFAQAGWVHRFLSAAIATPGARPPSESTALARVKARMSERPLTVRARTVVDAHGL